MLSKIKLLTKLFACYGYDLFRYYKHSNSLPQKNSLDKYESSIIFSYHVIEKGLTMPETRLGFGSEKIRNLIALCQGYIKDGYDPQRDSFVHAVRVLKEYLNFHEKHKYTVDDNLANEMRCLLAMFSALNASEQIELPSEQYFASKDMEFPSFCKSRRSIRNYSNTCISDSVFLQCAELAQTAPSACNRQPNKIYIIRNTETKKQVLGLQNGNKGFGDLASAIVIFTGDISSFRHQGERNELHLNSGMFAMTFIYALHHSGIGCCPLNWSVNPQIDLQLRKLIALAANETVTLILACGYPPSSVKLALSPRKTVLDIVYFIE